MRKHEGGFAAVEVVLAVVVLAAVGFAGWAWYQTAQTKEAVQQAEETEVNEENKTAEAKTGCADIEDHQERYNCYLNDESRQTLEMAVENNNPELCSEVEHVFTPHDVQSEIEEGVIGTVVEGEEAIAACERAVEQGRVPRGG